MDAARPLRHQAYHHKEASYSSMGFSHFSGGRFLRNLEGKGQGTFGGQTSRMSMGGPHASSGRRTRHHSSLPSMARTVFAWAFSALSRSSPGGGKRHQPAGSSLPGSGSPKSISLSRSIFGGLAIFFASIMARSRCRLRSARSSARWGAVASCAATSSAARSFAAKYSSYLRRAPWWPAKDFSA